VNMTSLKPFRCEDLLRFNEVNFDPLTETYGMSFYMSYLARWPEYFQKLENPDGEIVGYSKCTCILYQQPIF
jgi:N-terminal acetyltransferase B complex catalytic subunit